MSSPPANPSDRMSEYRRRNQIPDVVIQEFLRTTGYPSIEAYLEDQFGQGVHPRKAVVDLYWYLHPPITRLQLNRFNTGASGVAITGASELHLSKEFIDRWLRYPSRRHLSEFAFLEGITIPRMKFIDVRYLTPLPHQLGNPGYLVDQSSDDITASGGPVLKNPVITPLPCVLFDNEPLYIPVLRYAIRDPATYQEETHCGTYYYFDEGPQLYLKSNKTLITPDPAHALFYLRGGDARAAQLVLENKSRKGPRRGRREMFYGDIFAGPTYPPGPEAFDLAEKFQNHRVHCEPEEFENKYYEAKGDFEQTLCRLGRHLGYDVIISTHPSKINEFNPAGFAQLFDTRPREESFANLVLRIP